MTTAHARWLEPASASDDPRPVHYLILVILLVAGTLLRFWRLGQVGLYADEDLMALAARGVIEHGTPLMPSGLTYARAPVHTWMLAASVRIFGETEWALRLPSALAGTLCGWLAFVMGRRFLSPAANLAFVATILFLPSLIIDSLTARMYILLVACLLGFGAAVFRWERTERVSDLVLAFLIWLLALQFQLLAIMAAPLLLFPGLVRGSKRMQIHGVLALALAAICYIGVEKVTARFYPDPSQHPVIAAETVPAAETVQLGNPLLLSVIAVLAVAAIGALVVAARRQPLRPAAIALGLGVTFCAFQQYHLGGTALLVGVVLWIRSDGPRPWPLAAVLGAVAAMAALQIWMLHGFGLPLRKIVAAMLGRPGLWPLLRFGAHTTAGAFAYLGVLALAAVRVARRHPIPAHVLVYILVVWLQLLGIGMFRRDVPIRYTIGALPFFLMCVVAGVVFLLDAARWTARLRSDAAASMMFWGIAVALIVNPVEMMRAAHNDYASSPDHSGAAKFIRGLHPGPGDLLIAEDSIVQSWYLGRVDYRLLDMRVAAEHSVVVDGVVRGQYCGTPVLGSGDDLERVLAEPRSGHVYVIGSGEDFEDGRRTTRGSGIQEVLDSGRFEVVYHGRDHRTLVWRLRR